MHLWALLRALRLHVCLQVALNVLQWTQIWNSKEPQSLPWLARHKRLHQHGWRKVNWMWHHPNFPLAADFQGGLRWGLASFTKSTLSIFKVRCDYWLRPRNELHCWCSLAPLQWGSYILAVCSLDWRLRDAWHLHGGFAWTHQAQHTNHIADGNSPGRALWASARYRHEYWDLRHRLVLYSICQGNPD